MQLPLKPSLNLISHKNSDQSRSNSINKNTSSYSKLLTLNNAANNASKDSHQNGIIEYRPQHDLDKQLPLAQAKQHKKNSVQQFK